MTASEHTDVEQALGAFAAASGDDLSRLLLRAFRAVNLAVLSQLDPTGESGVKGAHVAIFASLDAAGTRLVDLAERSGISRQAASQLVKELEDAGMVESQPDPADGRATRVHLTAKGAAFCLEATEAIKRCDDVWDQVLGAGGVEALRGSLRTLTAALGPAQSASDS